MSWLGLLQSIDALDGVQFDAGLVKRMQNEAVGMLSRPYRVLDPDIQRVRERRAERLQQKLVPGVFSNRGQLRVGLRSLPGENSRANDFRDNAGDARPQGAGSRSVPEFARIFVVGWIQPPK